MSLARHCDYEDCDTWQPTATGLPDYWLTLSQYGEPDRHFCDLDHLMQWAAANSEPATIIDLAG